MKKVQSIFKTIGLIAVVLLVAQGCIPTVPGGNPTPASGTFDIGLNDGNATYDHPNYKVVKVDDDSLLFVFFTTTGWGTRRHITIGYKSSTGNQYEFYAGTQADSNSLNTLPRGVTVNGIPDAGHVWQPFTQQVWYTTRFDKEILLDEENSIDFVWYWKDIPNMERYIVFRRLRGAVYEYYWVWTGAMFTTAFPYNSPMTLGTFLFNGKYQMNSITTGQ